MNARDAWLRLRALFRRDLVEREMRDEVEFHLEMQARKHVARGADPVAARARARAEFGSVELAKEDIRDARRIRVFGELGQDARYALRGFRRAPLFALTVVLTIALGLGLNTTVFTIFNAYVLRPLEVRAPQELFEVARVRRSGEGHEFSWSDYQDLRRESSVFSETLAYRFVATRVDGAPLFGDYVSGNYFTMLGVGAATGRTILPEDAAEPGAAPVIVLSHDTWQGKFGGDSGIVGKQVVLRGVSLTVIGVARAGFGGLQNLPRDFWVPLTMMPAIEGTRDLFASNAGLIRLVGRLREGLGAPEARAALTVWLRRGLIAADADNPVSAALIPRSTPTALSPDILAVLIPIGVAFALVLVIGCANVASMMLARGMARQREIGIRLSLGAARGRLVRQLLTESALLAVPAAVIGFGLAVVTLDAGLRLLFATLPPELAPYLRMVSLQPDARVFSFILIAALASAVLFGLAPALQATRRSVVQAARGNFDNELRPSRLRNALVVGQIMSSVLLLICSVVLLRGSQRLERLDSGMRTRGLVQINLREDGRQAALAQLHNERLVTGVAAAMSSPVDGQYPVQSLRPAGTARQVEARYNHVSSGFFSQLGIPLVRGRNFTDDEARSAAGVVIVSASAATRFWPGKNAVGERLMIDKHPRQGRWGAPHLAALQEVRVIGVARDAPVGNIVFGTDAPAVYFPISAEAAESYLLVQVTGNADVARRVLEGRLERSQPGSLNSIHTLTEFVAVAVYPFQVAWWIAAVIGGIALLLTASGVFGVLSYVVSMRTREMGIRLALGATAGSVVTMVLRQSLRLGVLGAAVGAILALAGSRLLASQLAFIDWFDIPAYAGGAGVVLAACAVAAIVPSRRAANVDPVSALRHD